MLYTLTHHAYCGMPIPLLDAADRAEREEARVAAARRLRRMRREGYPVVTLERGERWEVREPEGCSLIPDHCGILSLESFDPLTLRYGACRECGFNDCWQEGGRGEVWCGCQTCGDCGETAEWCQCFASEEEG